MKEDLGSQTGVNVIWALRMGPKIGLFWGLFGASQGPPGRPFLKEDLGSQTGVNVIWALRMGPKIGLFWGLFGASGRALLGPPGRLLGPPQPEEP